MGSSSSIQTTASSGIQSVSTWDTNMTQVISVCKLLGVDTDAVGFKNIQSVNFWALKSRLFRTCDRRRGSPIRSAGILGSTNETSSIWET
jgi:hypothetical protein